MALGLYIHVPFCHHRCHFCAFYVRIHREDWVQAYLSALQREVHLHVAKGTLHGRQVETVYLGGGTPTTLTGAQLAEVLAWIGSAFDLAPHPEITIEAHPDTVSVDGLNQLRQSGYTRISFGIQSTDQQELHRIGRRTTAHPIQSLVGAARSVGFRSINLDLIYGLPGQTREQWMSSVSDTLACTPDHVSCYALTIEEHSHLHLDLKRGDRPPVDDDLQNELEIAADSRLTEAGFNRYEISNYAQPGHACRHNLLYWQGEDYLGLGPSAQSYVDGVRFGNLADLEGYHRSLTAGELPIIESTPLTMRQRRRETLVFGLRMTRGVPIELVGCDNSDAQLTEALDRLVKDGLLEAGNGRIMLTRAGRRLADSVAVALL